jgi:hypothetical protein
VAEYPAGETSSFATLGLSEAWFLGLSDLLGVALNRASGPAVIAPMEEGEPQ